MMLSVVVHNMISLLRRVNNIIYDVISTFLSGVPDYTVVYASPISHTIHGYYISNNTSHF